MSQASATFFSESIQPEQPQPAAKQPEPVQKEQPAPALKASAGQLKKACPSASTADISGQPWQCQHAGRCLQAASGEGMAQP